MIDLGIVGYRYPVCTHAWTSTDALLYALAVGAGQDDPVRELAFTTENSHGVEQQVVPTFPLVFKKGVSLEPLGSIPLERVVHAEQSLTLHAPIAVEGEARLTTEVTGVEDKGSGALMEFRTEIADASGSPLATLVGGTFVRGAGGFDPARKRSASWSEPPGEPDHVVELETRPEQALIYRLTGDRIPLHSDPWFAARAGFDKPILHGLCTFGYTARVLLAEVAGGDAQRFGHISGRFARPVFPGERLRVLMWAGSDGVRFRTLGTDGTVVLDRGTFREPGQSA